MSNGILNSNIKIITDKQEALELVKKQGFELWRVSEDLKDDWEVAYAAVMNDGRAFRFVSKRLKHNIEFVLAVISEIDWFRNWLPEEMFIEIEGILEMKEINAMEKRQEESE